VPTPELVRNELMLPLDTEIPVDVTFQMHCPPLGLGADNDGDGRIDEDPIDGEDNDDDGEIDEDPPFIPRTVTFNFEVGPLEERIHDPNLMNNTAIAEMKVIICLDNDSDGICD